jgi:hypothetical protein
MFVSCHHSAGQKQSIKIANKSFENTAELQYLWTALTKNFIDEDVSSRLNMGNAFCCFPECLSSFLMSEGVQIAICESIICLYCVGVELGSFTLREAHKLRALENKMLKKTFGAKRAEVTGDWRKLHGEDLHDFYSF